MSCHHVTLIGRIADRGYWIQYPDICGAGDGHVEVDHGAGPGSFGGRGKESRPGDEARATYLDLSTPTRQELSDQFDML